MIGGFNTYTYDATDQVTDADGTAYSYDADGNPTGAGDVVGSNNELTNDGTWTYTYDAAGNLVEKSKGAGLETWYYGYDTLNRLTSVEQTSNGTSLTYAVTYSYDVYGNRYEEQEWATGGATTVTYTAYDQGVAWADLTGSMTMQTRYLAGPGVNQWLGADHVGRPGMADDGPAGAGARRGERGGDAGAGPHGVPAVRGRVVGHGRGGGERLRVRRGAVQPNHGPAAVRRRA